MDKLQTAQVGRRMMSAYKLFLIRDLYLLENDVNERSLTHKLAEYMVPQFPGWDVDCEFNRSGETPKTLAGWRSRTVAIDDTNAQTVFPDIIVHRRGTEDNLLVVEAKKSSTSNRSEDDAKIDAYIRELGYQFGCLVTFPVLAATPAARSDRDIVVRSSPVRQ